MGAAMWKHLLTILFAATMYAAPGFADECPIHYGNTNYIPLVHEAIREASDCGAGVEIARLCSLGETLDPAITKVAQKKCEDVFLKRLTPVEQKGYRDSLEKCKVRKPRLIGGAAVSRMAFCRLNVARVYWNYFVTGKPQ
jgi:hypothetical protein